MKFKIGEIAVAARLTCNPNCQLIIGDEVTIINVGPFAIGTTSPHGPGRTYLDTDYEVTADDINYWFCEEPYLRKRRPPEEPAEDEFQEQLRDWLKDKKRIVHPIRRISSEEK